MFAFQRAYFNLRAHSQITIRFNSTALHLLVALRLNSTALNYYQGLPNYALYAQPISLRLVIICQHSCVTFK